jgi:osmotically inducible protein OsmC
MPVRTAEAEWRGNLRDGHGTIKLGSGAFEGAYSFASRFEEGRGTNPEELIGAAHAGCFSMALATRLTAAGYEPKRIHTIARVSIERVGDGFAITKSELYTEAEVPNIDEDTFWEQAEAAKSGCPVSKALAGTAITLDAKLISAAVSGT